MNLREITSWIGQQTEEERVFDSLGDSLEQLKIELYPDGIPPRENFGGIGYKELSFPLWEKPKGFEIWGRDMSEQVLSMASKTQDWRIRIETYIGEKDEEGSLLPDCYRIHVEPELLQSGIRLELYLPLDLLGQSKAIDVETLRENGSFWIEEIAHLNGISSDEDPGSGPNLLLGQIIKDPVLSLKFADWFLGGLVKAKKTVGAENLQTER